MTIDESETEREKKEMRAYLDKLAQAILDFELDPSNFTKEMRTRHQRRSPNYNRYGNLRDGRDF